MAQDAETSTPSASPGAITLEQLRVIARTDSQGREKQVLSIHDRFFARVLAPPTAWLAIKLGLSADAVTFLSVVFALAGAASLAQNTLAGNILAVALLQLSYLLDCADGDIARARRTSSYDGHLRDTFRHYLVNPAVFACLTLGTFQSHPHLWLVALGLFGAIFSTRIVSDLEDRVTLEALLHRLKKPGPLPQLNAEKVEQSGTLNFVRSLFLPDLAIMNWLSLAVIADAILRRALFESYTAVTLAFFMLAGAQNLMKCAGLVLLWRRGVHARVERLAAEIGDARRDQPH
jgi:hypothetical protein